MAEEFLDALDGAHEGGFGGDVDDFGDGGAGVGGCDGGVWDGAFLDAGVWFQSVNTVKQMTSETLFSVR